MLTERLFRRGCSFFFVPFRPVNVTSRFFFFFFSLFFFFEQGPVASQSIFSVSGPARPPFFFSRLLFFFRPGYASPSLPSLHPPPIPSGCAEKSPPFLRHVAPDRFFGLVFGRVPLSFSSFSSERHAGFSFAVGS